MSVRHFTSSWGEGEAGKVRLRIQVEALKQE